MREKRKMFSLVRWPMTVTDDSVPRVVLLHLNMCMHAGVSLWAVTRHMCKGPCVRVFHSRNPTTKCLSISFVTLRKLPTCSLQPWEALHCAVRWAWQTAHTNNIQSCQLLKRQKQWVHRRNWIKLHLQLLLLSLIGTTAMSDEHAYLTSLLYSGPASESQSEKSHKNWLKFKFNCKPHFHSNANRSAACKDGRLSLSIMNGVE